MAHRGTTGTTHGTYVSPLVVSNVEFLVALRDAHAIAGWPTRVKAFKEVAQQIRKANEEMIKRCDAVLGVLDGTEVDSGVASEIGFPAVLGKRCYGLRTNFRNCGDFDGVTINRRRCGGLKRVGDGGCFGR